MLYNNKGEIIIECENSKIIKKKKMNNINISFNQISIIILIF